MYSILMARLSLAEAARWSSVSEAVAIAAGIVLLLGLIGECPESERWKRSRWYKLAKYAVIGGVAFELIGGAGVFGTSLRLQELTDDSITERARVERVLIEQLKPRDLTKEEFKGFVSAIRGQMEPTTVFTISDPEAFTFGMELIQALQEADILKGWIRMPAALPNPPLPVNATGITLYVRDVRQRDSAKNTVDAFMHACVSASIKGCGAFTPEQAIAGVPSPSLFVMLHPVPFSWFPAYQAPPELPQPPWEPR